MASVSTMSSFIGGAAVVAQPINNCRCTLVVAKAAARVEGQDVATVNKEEKASNRRAAVVAVAAAAVTMLAGSAFAEEPKRGTPEARKKYAPICVTMPTARVCNKIA